MRRFSLLLFSLILALIAQRLLANADAFVSYILRDSLILTVVATLLFATNSQIAPLQLPFGAHRTSIPGWILVATGVLCAAAGGLLFVAPVNGVFFEQLRPTLWSVGLLLLLLGAVSRPRIVSVLPAVRWQKSNLGDFELVPLELSPRRQELMAQKANERTQIAATAVTASRRAEDAPRFLALRTEIGLLLIVLAVGALVNLWVISSLPTSCLPVECERLLHLSEQPAAPFFEAPSLLTLVQSQLIERLDDDLVALRLSVVIISTLSLLCFYLFARQLGTASGAVLATALLAVSPWHLWAMQQPDAFTTLFISLCGWLVMRSWWAETARWPTVAGIGLGIMLAFMNTSRGVTVLWVLVGLLLGALMAPAHAVRQRVLRVGLPLLVAVAVASPWLATGGADGVRIGEAQPLESQTAVDSNWTLQLQEIGAALFWRADFGPLGPALTGSILGTLVGALALLGVGVLARTLLRPTSIWLSIGLILYLWVTVQSAPSTASALTNELNASMPSGWAGALLPLLPLLFGGAALALDQLLVGFHIHWRRLVMPGAATALALLLLTIPALPTVRTLLDQAGSVGGAAQSRFDSALSQYLATNLAQDPALYFLPLASLESRTLKVMLGPQLEAARDAGQLRAMDLSSDPFFPAGASSGAVEWPNGVVYLVPAQERPLIDLLAQSFPTGVSQPIYDEQSGEPVATALRVDASTLVNSQGLQGYYFPGLDDGPPATSSLVEQATALQFSWPQGAPLEAPFSVRWEGALLAPESGDYRFVFNAGPEAQLSLRLDHALVLDSTQGVFDRTLPLARGVYRIELRYTALEEPSPLALLWQPPAGAGGNGDLEPVPQSVLRTVSLPVMGLWGAYAENAQTGAPAMLRKDLLVGLESSWSTSGGSVRWSGQLAAARSGEYMLAALTEGEVTLRVQGQTVVDTRANPPDEESIGYLEGLIYLEAGWRDIEIEYVAATEAGAAEQPGLRLFWQPPGSNPELLPGGALASTLATLSNAAAPLPPAPPLMDARLGDDRFALSVVPAFRDAQFVTPPAALPFFEVAPIWQISNGCGNGENQLNAPRGVAIDFVSGRVYVADTLNARVVELEPHGALRRILSDGQFQEPVDLEIQQVRGADAPNLLVLDAGTQQIFTIGLGESSTATALPVTASFYRPRGFDVDAAGNLLVADTGGARLVLLNADGQEIASYGGPESIFGLGQPADAMIVGGRYWAVTAEDGRLWRMEGAANDSGSIAAQLRSDTLNGPHLAALPDGRFFLSDPTGRTISYHAPNGEPRARFPASEQFSRPVGIDAVIRDGLVQLAVTDTNLCTVSLWQVGSLP